MSRDPSSPHQKEESDTQGGTVASTSAHPAAASNPKDGEAGKSTASVVEDGLTGTGTGSNEAADTSTSQQERQSQVLLEEEKDKTPEELRAELEKLRQELMSALQKKQGIDRQLVSCNESHSTAASRSPMTTADQHACRPTANRLTEELPY